MKMHGFHGNRLYDSQDWGVGLQIQSYLGLKGLTSWLSFVVSSVSLSLSHWYPGSGVVLDCIDS